MNYSYFISVWCLIRMIKRCTHYLKFCKKKKKKKLNQRRNEVLCCNLSVMIMPSHKWAQTHSWVQTWVFGLSVKNSLRSSAWMNWWRSVNIRLLCSVLTDVGKERNTQWNLCGCRQCLAQQDCSWECSCLRLTFWYMSILMYERFVLTAPWVKMLSWVFFFPHLRNYDEMSFMTHLTKPFCSDNHAGLQLSVLEQPFNLVGEGFRAACWPKLAPLGVA